MGCVLSAEVVKLVDTQVSGTCEVTRGGSSPLLGKKETATIRKTMICSLSS